MKRSEFQDGLEQVLYDAKECDGHDMKPIMEYIEKYMLPPSTVLKKFGVRDNVWDDEKEDETSKE